MSMLYLLDANVLIDASRDYYAFNRVPEFWDWLLYMGDAGMIKIPQEMYEEIISGTGELPEWLKENREQLLLQESVRESLVAMVCEHAYASDPTDEEVLRMGRDPFLVAYALVDSSTRVVVTNENSRPGRTRANRHIPDVCHDFRIASVDVFGLIRRLNFRTDWRAS